MRTLNQVQVGFILLLCHAIVVTPGCAPQQQNRWQTHRVRSSKPWEGRLQELFDDGIDGSAVGLAGQSQSHAGGLIGQRAEEAQYILHVRVVTVTTEGSGSNLRYLVTLGVTGDPVAGPKPPNDEIQITITSQSPSFGTARTKDLQLAGTRFIAFLREFEHQGTNVLHWHLARDGEDVVEAARRGALLSEALSD